MNVKTIPDTGDQSESSDFFPGLLFLSPRVAKDPANEILRVANCALEI
ncbi:hypothetical protein GCM10007420_22130 [Glycocaulis albus]|uniref:Uncharacterized protein n=1 Tax=Glycocaulis albus TaxID=1382801 RepID=A0ABQ1XWJ1_9PROT|nr:hypothetical protein [Glycocaulis albus]GGH05235.1 hypothetical protein GCM10007420_22130 [Glycocaulis albus]